MNFILILMIIPLKYSCPKCDYFGNCIKSEFDFSCSNKGKYFISGGKYNDSDVRQVYEQTRLSRKNERKN